MDENNTPCLFFIVQIVKKLLHGLFLGQTTDSCNKFVNLSREKYILYVLALCFVYSELEIMSGNCTYSMNFVETDTHGG